VVVKGDANNIAMAAVAGWFRLVVRAPPPPPSRGAGCGGAA
jgi:hypothetical protein